MPVIGIPVAELNRRIGREIDRDTLLRTLERIGCDVEGYETLGRVQCARCGYVIELAGKEEAPPRCDRCDADLRSSESALRQLAGIEVVRMELLAVRPDLFDPGGLGRALRGVLEIETGLPSYPLSESGLSVRVDGAVRRSSSLRPHIACAVLENVRLDDDRIKILMKMQENLHWALGRDRRHASIGVYDLDSLDMGGSPQLEYTAETPDYRFVPLGAEGTGPEHERSLAGILETHPKGIAYAHLMKGFDRYPILRAAGGRVLSMPPIINSEETKVHLDSTRLFVDVTGTGRRIVQRALNILVTSMVELDPGIRAASVEILGATDAAEGGALRTPDLAPQQAVCDVGQTARLLGIGVTDEELAGLLRRMRHGVEVGSPGRLRVLVPPYRNDILHQRDLMEDAAIAYGYSRIPPTLVPTMTVGKPRDLEVLSDRCRDVMIGLGLIETMGLVLTCPEQSDRLLDRPDHPDTVELANPISSEQTHLRTSLIPGLLATVGRNRSNPLPQGIFEVGDVTFVDPQAETGALERRHLALGWISPKAGFADIRALAQAVVREFGWDLVLAPAQPGFFIDGRGAVLRAPDGCAAGVLGELHPRVLERLGLQNPVVVLEMAIPGPGGPEPYLSMP